MTDSASNRNNHITLGGLALNAQLRSPKALITCIFLLIFLVATIVGCQSNSNLPLVIVTPSPTITPTPACPPNILATPNSLKNAPTLFVILIKTDNDYETYSSRVFEILNKIIPNIVQPGDKIVILRQDVRTFDDSIILNGHAQSYNPPNIPSTPTMASTVTPVAILGTTIPGYSGIATQNAIKANQTAIIATGTYSAFTYNCAINGWNGIFQSTATAWVATKSATINDFSNQIQNNLNEYQLQSKSLPKAMSNMVYEGLSHASLIFQNECSYYSRCKLIIFSDLQDWRSTTPTYVKIDLEGIDIISVMLNCAFLYQPSCQQELNIWTPNFTSYGVRSVVYLNGDDIENKLIEINQR